MLLLTSNLDQSRKRGTLESDLLMSTFADSHLNEMTPAQLSQYDKFLDENDWDIYYWATQEPTPTSRETAEGSGAGPEGATPNVQGKDQGSPVPQGTDQGKQTGPVLETDEWRQGKPRSGEWAQTVGTFKPAYRPVPARWKNSEILAMLRRHVISRSAGGIHEGTTDPSGEDISKSVKSGGGGTLLIIITPDRTMLIVSRYGIHASSFPDRSPLGSLIVGSIRSNFRGCQSVPLSFVI